MKPYQVEYTKKIGGNGSINVRANDEKQALNAARFHCFTGSDFRNAKIVDDLLYFKPSKQGFQGSERV